MDEITKTKINRTLVEVEQIRVDLHSINSLLWVIIFNVVIIMIKIIFF